MDAEGFKSEKEVTLASVRAYREGRHGSERWANMAAFSEATDLFRFRVIPGVSVTTDLCAPLRWRPLRDHLCGRREGPGDVSGGHGKGGEARWLR